jgi:hypothetical protein
MNRDALRAARNINTGRGGRETNARAVRRGARRRGRAQGSTYQQR